MARIPHISQRFGVIEQEFSTTVQGTDMEGTRNGVDLRFGHSTNKQNSTLIQGTNDFSTHKVNNERVVFNMSSNPMETGPLSHDRYLWGIPRDVRKIFVGRRDILETITDGIKARTKIGFADRFVITGPGGIGKTELCYKLVESIRTNDEFEYVLPSGNRVSGR